MRRRGMTRKLNTIGQPINSVTAAGSLDVSAVFTSKPAGIGFRSDGLIMYLVSDAATSYVYQFTLSTAFDITTATYDNLKVAHPVANPLNLKVKDDYFYVGRSTMKKYQIINTNDISASTDTGDSFIFQEQGFGWGFDLNAERTKAYSMNSFNNGIKTFVLNPTNTLSSAVINTESLSYGTSSFGMSFYNSGKNLVVGGVKHYKLTTPYNLNTAIQLTDLNTFAGRGVFVNDTARKIYISDAANSYYQYNY